MLLLLLLLLGYFPRALLLASMTTGAQGHLNLCLLRSSLASLLCLLLCQAQSLCTTCFCCCCGCCCFRTTPASNHCCQKPCNLHLSLHCKIAIIWPALPTAMHLSHHCPPCWFCPQLDRYRLLCPASVIASQNPTCIQRAADAKGACGSQLWHLSEAAARQSKTVVTRKTLTLTGGNLTAQFCRNLEG